MKNRIFLLLTMLLGSHFAWGTCSWTRIIYQPIMVGSEGHVSSSKGYIILPIPYHDEDGGGRPPHYSPICQRNAILSANGNVENGNLLAEYGMTIGGESGYSRSEFVTLYLENVKEPREGQPSIDDAVEAAIECIRQTALVSSSRPVLQIFGKSGEEEKWKTWKDKFNRQSFAEPFTRPTESKEKYKPQ